MHPDDPRPTSSETTHADRLRIVTLAEQGWSRAAIAAEIGCSVRTVDRWLARVRSEGLEGLHYRSRRPHRPHPQTTDPAIVARIDEVRTAHPGWGARLIRRQILLDGWEQVPSEVTVRHWVRRLGHPSRAHRRREPLGWSTPAASGDVISWQMDFKVKGGSGTAVSLKANDPDPAC